MQTQWLASADPRAMLEALRDHGLRAPDGLLLTDLPSDRKLRLFACACYFGIFIGNKLGAVAAVVINAAERWADGEISPEEAVAVQPPDNSTRSIREAWYLFQEDASAAARDVAALHSTYTPAHRAALLREVVGDPFSVPSVLPRTAATLSLARHIYAERDFALMGLLRDALMDGGCGDEAALSHCLESGHVRGCWLIDRLLEKS